MANALPHANICVTAAAFHDDLVWQWAQLQQLVGSVCGTLAIAYFLLVDKKMPQIFAQRPKILVRWMMTFILVHDLCILLIICWHKLLRLQSNGVACNLVLVTWKCMLLRIPATAAITGMSVIFLLTTVDSFCHIYLRQRYERCTAGRTAPLGIAVCITIFVTFSTLSVFYGDDVHALKAYCYVSSPLTNARLIRLYTSLLLIDVTCTICVIFFIRRSFDQLTRNKHEFVVQRKMEMRSNVAAMRFLLASTFLRCIFVWPFLFGSVFVRVLLRMTESIEFLRVLSANYIIPWYGCAFAFILYYWRPFRLTILSIRNVSAHEQRAIHFEQLKKQWI